MSEMISEAVTVLNAKMGGEGFDGIAKFVILEEGTILIDASGARAADEAADVTLTADLATFKGILDGDIDPTSAFMSGRLSVDGDLGMAMKLGSILA